MKDMANKIKEFLFPQMHEFDLNQPIIKRVEIVETHKIDCLPNYVDVVRKNLTFEGYQCQKCSKIMWLDKEFMTNLPRKMRKCEKS